MFDFLVQGDVTKSCCAVPRESIFAYANVKKRFHPKSPSPDCVKLTTAVSINIDTSAANLVNDRKTMVEFQRPNAEEIKETGGVRPALECEVDGRLTWHESGDVFHTPGPEPRLESGLLHK